MRRALIIDGTQRSTLAVVRSLGAQGVQVVVGEDSFPCLSSRSKFCGETFQYTCPETDPKQFIEDITVELRRQSYDLLIPMTDTTTYLVVEHFQALSQLTEIPVAPYDHYHRAIDKGTVVEICQRLDIPAPRTTFITSPTDLVEIAPTLDYPVVIKPRQSQTLTDSGWISAGVDYAFSVDELQEKFSAWNPAIPLPLIQERIKGSGAGAFLLFGKSEPKAIFFHKRLREKPPSGGVSVLRESLPIHNEMKDFSIRLLTELNWHGPAMVEFKLDEHDGLPKVIEINARFWGSLQLAIDAGVDFPYLLYHMAVTGDVEPVMEYRTGAKSRWLLGDLDHLLLRLLRSKERLRLPPGSPGRLRILWEFMKFWQSDTRFEILRIEDIGPFLFELKQWLRQVIGR